MKKVLFLIICFLLCLGCSTGHKPIKSLAIMKLVRNSGPKLVYLSGDYGFLIYWLDNREPELYIYDKPGQEIKMTRNFSDFLSNLRLFPEGAKVDRITGCAISAAGMPAEYNRDLNEVIKAKGFVLTDYHDGNFSVCTCETSSVRRYKTVKSAIEDTLEGSGIR